MMLFEQIYDAGPNGHWVFLLCTVILGASGAFVTGRAIADTWRPLWQAVVYALLLTFFVRFIHFALFEEVLVSLKNYAVDAAILTLASVAGYVLARRRQMASQYAWLQG